MNDYTRTGIYLIEGPNKNIYIGFTMTSFEKRWKGHVKLLSKGNHHCKYLQNAWAKYSSNDFNLKILEYIDDPNIVLEKERYWWNHFKNNGFNLYNSEPSGKGSVFHSNETKLKLSQTIRIKPPEEFFNDFEKGCTIRFLVDKYNYSLSAVKRALRDQGFDTSQNHAKNNLNGQPKYFKQHDDSQLKQELLERFIHGNETMNEIAESWNVSTTSVWNKLKKYGFPTIKPK